MPRGSKDKYTDKQKCQAEHIEEGYEKKGISDDEAERRAWATVNKESGGGEKEGGSGHDTSESEKEAGRKSVGKSGAATLKRRGTGRGVKTAAGAKKTSGAKKTIAKPTVKKASSKPKAKKKNETT